MPYPSGAGIETLLDALQNQATVGGVQLETIRRLRQAIQQADQRWAELTQREEAVCAESEAARAEAVKALPESEVPGPVHSGTTDPARESLPDFKMLFEQAPGLYLVVDPDLRIVAASDAWLRASGARREDIMGRYVFDALPDNPDDPTADSVRNSLASFNRVLRTRQTDTIGLQRHDVRKPESEGGEFVVHYWSVINCPVLNPDGSVAYIINRVEDATEFILLKQRGLEKDELTDALREQALKLEADIYARSREMAESSQKLKLANEDSEQRYRTLFDSIDEGYCIIEMRIEPNEPLDYRFIEVNQAFERQSTLVNAQGKWMRELRPEHEESWFEIYRDVALTGKPVRFEHGGRALQDRWFTLYAFRIGRPEQRHVAVLFNDITERKRAEEALRRALAEAEEGRQTLRALMEHIPMGITVADAPDVTIRAVSRYGQELTGKPHRQIEGIPVDLHVERWHIFRSDGVTPATSEELPLTRATQKGELVREEEFVIGRPDDAKVPILCTAGPIYDAQGDITGGVIGWQDITGRKQAEMELRRLHGELEQRVERRTAELAAANRELEAFAYTVSHDLRAPLRHVINFAEMLDQESGPELDEERRRYVRIITDSAQRMGNLIEDLLALCRLGRTAIEESDVSLRELVEEARRQLAPETSGRAIEWQIGPLPEVRGDTALLRSVMANLLSNAIKFTRSRKPARIEIGCQEQHGETVFFIRDNGAGFDMRFADKLFGVFQRLHAAERFEGTGVGLASVRRIIERHGGRTWAEGAVDQGATFYFSLPPKRQIDPSNEGCHSDGRMTR